MKVKRPIKQTQSLKFIIKQFFINSQSTYMSNFDAQTQVKRITQKFQPYDLKKPYTYDEILFILDQQSNQKKCDRDVARQLYQQSLLPNGKANLDQIIFRYVENLQTSKLCLLRQQKAADSLKDQLGTLKGASKAYAYLKIIQITAHARYSSMPSLTYKIEPSDIPPITVVNSLNPILNHQFTLQLDQNNFSIIFFQSGVKIAEWVWPDSKQSTNEGEYYRNVMGQKISFELKINYKPKNYHSDRKVLEERLTQSQNRANIERKAMEKLEKFSPFSGKKKNVSTEESKPNRLVEKIFQCLPLLRNHLRNFYYSLIFLIIVQSIASISWPMQFLDITVAFGVIGMIYDQSQSDLGMQMLVFMFSMCVLIIKSLWGIVTQNKQNLNWTAMLIICIISKLVCIQLAWIVSVCKQEVPRQRQLNFYEGVDPSLNGKYKQFQEEDI